MFFIILFASVTVPIFAENYTAFFSFMPQILFGWIFAEKLTMFLVLKISGLEQPQCTQIEIADSSKENFSSKEKFYLSSVIKIYNKVNSISNTKCELLEILHSHNTLNDNCKLNKGIILLTNGNLIWNIFIKYDLIYLL